MSHDLEDNHGTANPPMTLDERRALLRTALTESDPDDISGFAAAIEGANEDDRAALARTLPAARLARAEATPRACYALAALGKPETAAELVPDSWGQAGRARAAEFKEWADKNIDAMLMGLAGRSENWCYQFINAACDRSRVPIPLWQDAWNLVQQLIDSRSLLPESDQYLDNFTFQATTFANDGPTSGNKLAEFLCSEERFLRHDLWALFRVEGFGNPYSFCCSDAWDKALLILCDKVPSFRGRLLDESLQALLRDFSAHNVVWYQRVHRLLNPTPDEVLARVRTYLAVLGTAPSTSVSLAQDMVKRAMGSIDLAGLLDASETVLRRPEKKLVKAQLGLLRALVKAQPSVMTQVSEIVAGAVDNLPPDLVANACRLIMTEGASAGEAEPTDAVQRGSVESVVVPPPRDHSLLPVAADVQPIADERELWNLVAAFLEGEGNGADIPRVLSYLNGHPEATNQAMLERAQAIVGPYDDYDEQLLYEITTGRTTARQGDIVDAVGNWGSPRRQLAALLQVRAGEKIPAFMGYFRQVESETADVGCPIVITARSGSGLAMHETREIVGYYWFEPRPTNIPTALLAEQFGVARGDIKAWLWRDPGAIVLVTAPLPRVSRHWERVVTEPWWASVLQPGPKPFWMTLDKPSSPEHRSWAALACDVSGVPDEFAIRADAAREEEGHDQIVQWAAWLYANNPDILAAQFHPLLWEATQVVNVRGVLPLLAALGESRQLPGGPTYSALALGLSAKQADHRAAAAEAVAALAGRGLLVPESFTAEIAAHLKDGFVLAGRLASALADAASINPIAGYRVLQTLAAVLPHLDGVNQAAKLVELTAKLAADYGTPVPIPETLTGKTKGSSLMAVSLRLLADVRPTPTALLQAAAEQAAAALDA